MLMIVWFFVQLDDACRRHGKEAGIGGPMVVLSVWMWERFSVGRPKILPFKNWDDHGNPLRRPTWAYKWDVVSEFTGDPIKMYRLYTNEFDTLTADQVIIALSIFVAIWLILKI
jgi:hypothetical protein